MKPGFSRLVKPMDNAYIKSFNGRLPAECLNENGFLNLDDVQEQIESWRLDYSQARPDLFPIFVPVFMRGSVWVDPPVGP